MIWPSGKDFSNTPAPVANRTTTEPGAAGLLAELIVPSSFNAATGPFPDPSYVNKPGIVSTTASETGRLLDPVRTVTVVAVWPVIPYGTITLIWSLPAYVIGAA